MSRPAAGGAPPPGAFPFARLFLDGAPLVLASASPRRAGLLRLVGAEFEVVVPAEEPEPHADWPHQVVMALAHGKALSVAASRPGAWVLGADTLVWSRGRPLGKPRDRQEARAMLGELSGAWHSVYTGLCLVRGGAAHRAWERSEVRFRNLTHSQIDSYVDTGEPLDKAGAYGIQGFGALWVERVEGCYFNVMGLPLARLARLFEAAGGARLGA
ncbi:MAG TPA: Maf family protein [Candidatus Saccharimonadales bacterium]|nr:Maf family protein [Candidatus Saccharimonadales bacterium]